MYSPRLLAATLLGSLVLAGATACAPTGPARGSGGPAPSASPASTETTATGTTATGTTATGIAALSPGALVKKSQAAGAAVNSVTLTFDLTDSGTRMTGTAAADRKGDCVLQLTQGGQGQLEIMRQAGADTVWMKGDTAFMEQAMGSADARLLKGKYLKASANDPDAKDSLSLCDMGLEMLKTVGQAEDGSDATGLTGAGKKQVGSATGLVVKDDGVTLVIAADGPPLLLEQTEGGATPGSFRFSGFDQPVTVTPPPSSEVVDTTK